MAYDVSHSITNSDAESGTTGWDNETGGLGTRSASPAPYQGSAYFFGGTSDPTLAIQQSYIDLVSSGVSVTDISDNKAEFQLSWMQASYDGGQDPAGMGFRFYDSAYNLVFNYLPITLVVTPSLTWASRSAATRVPTNARYVKAYMYMDRTSGVNNDGYIEGISANTHVYDTELLGPTSSIGAYQVEVLTAQTAPTTSLGAYQVEVLTAQTAPTTSLGSYAVEVLSLDIPLIVVSLGSYSVEILAPNKDMTARPKTFVSL